MGLQRVGHQTEATLHTHTHKQNIPIHTFRADFEEQGLTEVQWLRLFASTAVCVGLTPGRGTNVPHTAWPPKVNNNSDNNIYILKKLKNNVINSLLI